MENRKYICCGTADIEQIRNMIDRSADQCLILEGNMMFRETLVIEKPIHIIGNGCTITVEGDVNAMEITSDKCRIEGLSFLGGAEYNNSAIFLKSALECRISDCYFKGFKNSGIFISYSVGSHQGNLVSGCFFEGNAFGIRIMERAEYVQVSGCSFFHNDNALYIQGGNANISNCIISDNKTGVHIDNGDNHAHGILNGCSMNHNIAPLIATDISFGFILNGCLIYCGKIEIKGSRFIKFYGCDLSYLEIDVQDSSDCYAFNCHMIEKYQNPIEDSNSLAINNNGLVFKNCFGGSFKV
jgi:nitrous oxidase accessory protein NosD